ncbi:porin [Burkholderia multivorans]|uniref:porin n=1 Tax=Burkholderia multivorans TaxID=87883 RepID=UPI0035BE9ADF
MKAPAESAGTATGHAFIRSENPLNKKLLTTAILAATAGVAHAQSSVTLYGVIDAGISSTTHSASVRTCTVS